MLNEKSRHGLRRYVARRGRLAMRIGPWLYQVKLGKELRFPNVTHHLQSPTGAAAGLQIAPADAQFPGESLPRLPGSPPSRRSYPSADQKLEGDPMEILIVLAVVAWLAYACYRSRKRTGSVRGFNVGRHGRRWRRR